MKKILLFLLTLSLSFLISTGAFAQYGYNWATATTGSNTGERVVAIIDAGTVGSYDGIGIIGEVVDDNGNWGQNVPVRSDFNMNVRFSAGLSYHIEQERKTSNIVLRLRKISNSKIHLTAYLPNAWKAVSVSFDVVVSSGLDTVALGSTSVLDSSGELVISEPTYESNFDGKLGIGTTNPGEALTVKGKVHAEEVIVNLNVPGPDYVFEEDYDLPTLAEIETFIKANKHLPEVLSAAEMEEEGIILGDMNMLLLKKIEEMTLLMIEMEKRIQQLEESEND